MNQFGEMLVTRDGDVDAASTLGGDDIQAIGIYFSAHWCPPCRSFTPSLANFYNETNKDKKRFEIVFVSLDRDEASFKEYLSEMPWCAVRFEAGERETLPDKFGVNGIPKLVLLNKSGEELKDKEGKTMDGRQKVSSGDKFDSWF